MLPFAGIPSFARSPLESLDSDWQADVGILGVPFDIALGYRPGARFAPRAIREASLRFSLPPDGFYDLRDRRVRLKGLELRDVGDVDVPSLEPQLARQRIEAAARQLRSKARLPIFLGGDHSISHPYCVALMTRRISTSCRLMLISTSVTSGMAPGTPIQVRFGVPLRICRI